MKLKQCKKCAFCWFLLHKFHLVTAYFSRSPTDLNSSQLNPFALKHQKILFRIMHLTISRPYFSSHCFIRFTFIVMLLRSQRRAWDAWARYETLVFHSYRDFPFLLLFYRSFRLSFTSLSVHVRMPLQQIYA
jgi:hypothetical protein